MDFFTHKTLFFEMTEQSINGQGISECVSVS